MRKHLSILKAIDSAARETRVEDEERIGIRDESESPHVSRDGRSMCFGYKLSAFSVSLMLPLMANATLGAQIEKIDTLVRESVMKTGIIGASVIGFIIAMVKGSMKVAFTIIGIGLAFAYFLAWIKDGNFNVG